MSRGREPRNDTMGSNGVLEVRSMSRGRKPRYAILALVALSRLAPAAHI